MADDDMWDEILAKEEAPAEASSHHDPAPSFAHYDDSMPMDNAHDLEMPPEQHYNTQERQPGRGMKRKMGDLEGEEGEDFEVDDEDEDEDDEEEGAEGAQDEGEDGAHEEGDDEEEDEEDDEGPSGSITGRILTADVRLPLRPQRKKPRVDSKSFLASTEPDLRKLAAPITMPAYTSLATMNKYTIKESPTPRVYNARVNLNVVLDQPLNVFHIPTIPAAMSDSRPRLVVPIKSTTSDGGEEDTDKAKVPVTNAALPSWFKRETISREEKLAFFDTAPPASAIAPLAFEAITNSSAPPSMPSLTSITSTPAFHWTQEQYLKARNSIVDLYEADPKRPLTISRIAKEVGGNFLELYQLYQFLVHWGVINNRCGYLLHDDSLLLQSFSQNDNASNDSGSTGPQIKAEVKLEGSLLKKYDDVLKAVINDSRRPRHVVPVSTLELNSPLAHSSDFKSYKCFITGRVINGEPRYQCLKAPHVVLSEEAYVSGAFPSNFSSIDFVRVEDTEEEENILDEMSWTPAETLRLLEGVERFGENWAEIATFVGGRTAAECIEHFIRLPVEEILMSATNLQSDTKSEAELPKEAEGEAKEDLVLEPIEAHSLFPLMATPNPIMALIIFIQRLLSPEIASVAAQAAAHSLMQSKEGRAVKVEGEVSDSAANALPTDEELLTAYSNALEAARKRVLYLIRKEESLIVGGVSTALSAQKQKLQLLYENVAALEKQLQEEEAKVDTAKATMKKDEERIETSIKALSTLIPQVTPTKLNKPSEKLGAAASGSSTSVSGGDKKDESKEGKKDEKASEKADEEGGDLDAMEFDENFELDPEIEKALNQIEDMEEEKAPENEEAVALPDDTKATKLEEIVVDMDEEEADLGDDKMDIDTDKA